MGKSQKLLELKETIIDYLLQCPRNTAKRNTFWLKLGEYTNKQIIPTNYGIPKMKNAFEAFKDVLIVTPDIVRLRNSEIKRIEQQGKKRQEPSTSQMNDKDDASVITVSDSDSEYTEDESDSDSSSRSKDRKSLNASQESSMSWGSGAATKEMMFFSTPRAQEPPKSDNFLAFSMDKGSKDGAGGKSKPSHLRYGISSTDTPGMSSLPPSLRSSTASSQPDPRRPAAQNTPWARPHQSAPNPIPPGLYRFQGGQGQTAGPGPQQALFQNQSGQFGSQENLLQTQFRFPFQPDSQRNQSNPYLPSVVGNIHQLRSQTSNAMQHQNTPGSQMQVSSPSASLSGMTPSSLRRPDQIPQGAMGGFASPALLAGPAATGDLRSTLTEFPKPKSRTGPPAGTKMPEPPKIKVKSINLQRGATLSVEMVDYEINDCIDILSNANEHVSTERVEELLLGKFKVMSFRALNLQNKRYLTQMDSANEHNRLLCKVDVYVRNFARSRSLCTLYELSDCCREFHKHKEEFDKLRLGPLQKMPAVHDLFKFPMDEYIPEITTVDILEQLEQYLTQNNLWTTQVQLSSFLEFLEKHYEVESSFSLGIRIRSLPLAIQTLKKAKRDAGQNRRKVLEEMMIIMRKDIGEAFSKFRESLLQTSDDPGTYELRRHYCSLVPANAVKEMFQKFTLLAEIMSADVSSAQARQFDRLLRSFDSFVKQLFDGSFPEQLFHLAICMSNTDLEETALEFMNQQKHQSEMRNQQESAKQNKQPPPKNILIETILKYLNQCLEIGALQLSHLKSIEEKIVEDCQFSSFQEIGHSSFLEFLLSDKKLRQVLEECGGTLLGSSTSSHESGGSVIASQKDLLKFICQTRDAGVVQSDQLAQSLCEQYHVAEVKALGHGNINRLCQLADKSTRNVSRHPNCIFEAAVCGKSCRMTRSSGNVGLQGSQSKESAIACLAACPLLEDMSDWSHWPLLFQPQHGSLRDFITEHGGVKFHSIDGGKRTATSDIMAIETESGKFLKLSAQSTQDNFLSALEAEDPLLAAGHLVSLIVSNKGIEATPLALLTNHLKSKLISLHAQMATPGGPPHSMNIVDPAVQFVTSMLLRLPLRICIAIANQVLLEPLSQVVGSAKSKVCISLACRSPGQRLKLEQLGCLLGVQEWMASMTGRMAFPAHLIQDNVEEEDDGSQLADQTREESDDAEESNEEEEEDDLVVRDEESEIEHILSVPIEGLEKLAAKETETPHEEMDKQAVTVDKEGGHDETTEEESSSSSESEEGDEEASDESGEEDESGSGDAKQKQKKAKEEKEEGESEVSDEGMEEKEESEEKIERELTKEEKCQKIIDSIREKEFGVGVKLSEELQDLMQKQQERQGRSLERLSKELYSKDTHFVLELIQNADDNHYNEDIVPSIKFVIDTNGVTVMNNELGFEEKNIRALCDVGKSTKPKHNLGYIGQKGIGFKSVFRVTGRPEVHSNGFHMYFDVNSGPMGYIMPHWCQQWEDCPSWQTQIALPWTQEIANQITTHAARFNDIQPSLLLFLHRLKQITIDNQVEKNELCMEREDLENGQVQISHTHGKDRWLVVRKRLDASTMSLQVKSGVEVDSTEIALAFPINTIEGTHNVRTKPRHLPVFAFLPLRSYGFKFIIQGDFDVPSSREDVDRDSSWNQWLRTEIPYLFLDAWESFQSLPNLSPVEALVTYLQFVPMDGEVMDFFKPVANHILSQLRAKEFLPAMGTAGDIQWKMPSKTVICRDSLVREIISPALLKHHLALFYLHDDVASVLDNAQVEALGVEKITTEHLLLIGQSVTLNWNDQGSPDQVVDIAKWMACVYRSLNDFQDNTETIQKLCTLKILPLSSGQLVSVEDTTVFLLQEDKQHAGPAPRKGKAEDPFRELKSDLNLVHGSLTATADNEINSQVVKLLLKMGVKQLTPYDLIHSHVMPSLESGQWKSKPNKVVVCYLTFIKSEMDKNASIVDIERLRPVAPVLTNQGLTNPSRENVHFTKEFGNPVDLQKTFPGMKWTLVDHCYLPPNASPLDVQTWHQFLSKLGVNDFLCVRKEEVQVEQSKLQHSPWSSYEGVWPSSVQNYVIDDFVCIEFHQLAVMSNPPADVMRSLYLWLDKMWDSLYKGFCYTQLKSASGDILKDTIESSFFIHLKTLPWVPARWLSVDSDNADQHVNIRSETGCRPPHKLYAQRQDIKDLLGDTVEYLDVQVPDGNSSFSKNLQVRDKIDRESVKNALVSWGQREEAKMKVPTTFHTKMRHIVKVYEYLINELSRKDSQILFHDHPVFFIPLSHSNPDLPVAGHMMKREEVCWHDDTGLFTKHHQTLKLYQSPLATCRFMQPFYQRFEGIFEGARLKKTPDALDCSELLKHIASVLSLQEEGTLRDALVLMSRIGSDLARKDLTEAGVATFEAQQAQLNVEKVKKLLSPCVIFPTKGGKWVSLVDKPMISDSPELERLFTNKPGVHFIQSELPDPSQRTPGSRKKTNKISEDFRLGIETDSIELFLSLFDGIKPLSDCIDTKIITPGFKPCFKGQMYMHNVIPLLQKFLYFVFPDVYDLVKQHKSSTFGELQFIQVQRLEVKYEFIDRPDVCEIREDKCYVEDKMFYFHEKYVDEQAEIHREVSKFLSHGNDECSKEMRNFLSQAMAILEGKSNESLEDLLSRQRQQIYDLPDDEPLWKVQLPRAPPPLPPPRPPPAMEEETMVYGRSLSSGSATGTASGQGENDENAPVMTNWPPRSLVDIPLNGKKLPDAASPRWPLPDGQNYAKTSRQLPSNIEFESEPQTEEDKEKKGEDEKQASTKGEKSKSRIGSSSGKSDPSTKAAKEKGDGKGDVVGQKEKPTAGGEGDSKKTNSGGTLRQNSQTGEFGPPRAADIRQHVVTLAEKGDDKTEEAGLQETGKRKWRQGSESDTENTQARKRSSTELPPPSQLDEQMDSSDALVDTSRESAQHSDGSNMNDSRHTPKASNDKRHPDKSGKMNKFLRLSIPLWNNQMEDLRYTEVAKGTELEFHRTPLPENSLIQEIGRWGEALVYNYLLKQMDSNPTILEVVWANEGDETGLPFDIEIIYKTENDEDQYSVFVDVKATTSEEKAVFEISPRQIECAMEHKERYQIFRVYNAGKDDVRLVRIDNIADRMLTKSVQLYLMI